MSMHIVEEESGRLSRDECTRLIKLMRAVAFETQDDNVSLAYLDFNVGEVMVLLHTREERRFTFSVTSNIVCLRSENGKDSRIKVVGCSTQKI